MHCQAVTLAGKMPDQSLTNFTPVTVFITIQRSFLQQPRSTYLLAFIRMVLETPLLPAGGVPGFLPP